MVKDENRRIHHGYVPKTIEFEGHQVYSFPTSGLGQFAGVDCGKVFISNDGLSVILSNVAKGFLKKILVGMQLVLEQGFAQGLLDLSLTGQRSLPARKSH